MNNTTKSFMPSQSRLRHNLTQGVYQPLGVRFYYHYCEPEEHECDKHSQHPEAPAQGWTFVSNGFGCPQADARDIAIVERHLVRSQNQRVTVNEYLRVNS